MNNEVLAIILGGGQGSRLFPLTQLRSKPAVPIGGKYRLIDIPISNCLHADIRRIFVLTQFNSASLNRHISQTYRMDLFSPGFVEILAAEITPENTNWFQGTADAVRKAARHFVRYDADYYLILAGDHLYRMDYSEMVDAHIDRRADITIAAQPCTPEDATEMGIFRFDRDGHIVAFEEKPNAERLAADRPEHPERVGVRRLHAGEAVRRLDGHVRVLARRAAGPARGERCARLRPRGDPVGTRQVPRERRYLFRGYWADVGTVESFYDANIMLTQPGSPFKFYDPTPADLHARPIPARFAPGRRARAQRASSPKGAISASARSRSRSSASARTCCEGTTITRSVLLGADYYEADDVAPARGRCAAAGHRPRRRARPGDRGQERPHRRRLRGWSTSGASTTRTATATTSATASSSCRRTG